MTLTLPLFPLSRPLFPGMVMPLRLFEERYLRLFREHAGDDPFLGVVLTKSGREVHDESEMHPIGTSATLLASLPSFGNAVEILLQGGSRFRLLSSDWTHAYATGHVEWFDDTADRSEDVAALARRAKTRYQRLVEAFAIGLDIEVPEQSLPIQPSELSYDLAQRLPSNTWEQQALLETPAVADRLRRLIEIIGRERTLLELQGTSGPALEHPGPRFLPN